MYRFIFIIIYILTVYNSASYATDLDDDTILQPPKQWALPNSLQSSQPPMQGTQEYRVPQHHYAPSSQYLWDYIITPNQSLPQYGLGMYHDATGKPFTLYPCIGGLCRY